MLAGEREMRGGGGKEQQQTGPDTRAPLHSLLALARLTHLWRTRTPPSHGSEHWLSVDHGVTTQSTDGGWLTVGAAVGAAVAQTLW